MVAESRGRWQIGRDQPRNMMGAAALAMEATVEGEGTSCLVPVRTDWMAEVALWARLMALPKTGEAAMVGAGPLPLRTVWVRPVEDLAPAAPLLLGPESEGRLMVMMTLEAAWGSEDGLSRGGSSEQGDFGCE